MSLNIAVFLALLLLLENQPTVGYHSAGIKGDDHLDIAVAILLWARTLPVEVAVSDSFLFALLREICLCSGLHRGVWLVLHVCPGTKVVVSSCIKLPLVLVRNFFDN